MKHAYGVALAMLALLAVGASTARAQNWIDFTDTRTVLAVTQRGSDIWLGTGGGLIRWSTNDVKDYYYRSNSGLPNNTVENFFDDGAQGMWMATFGGLAHFDGSTWASYNMSNSEIPSDQITSIYRAADGKIWVGTYYNGVACLNGSTWTRFNTDNSQIPDNHIVKITGDQHHLWMASQGSGVIEYDGSQWYPYNDKNGTIASDFAGDVLVDSTGRIWAATSRGVAMYNGNTWWTFDNSNSALPANDIVSLTLDHDGNVWAATGTSGIAKYAGTTWTAYTHDLDSVPEVRINSMMIASDNTIWLATVDGAYYRTGTGWKHVATATTPFVGNAINAVGSDPTGRFWFASTYFGVAVIKGDAWSTYNADNNALPASNARTLATDYAGRVWVGTPSGAAVFDNGTWTKYTSANSPLHYPINGITVDSSGTVWLADDGDGVKAYADGAWKGYDHMHDNLPTDNVNAIAVDKAKKVWIGTESGVGSFNGSAWTVYTASASGLPASTVSAIATDPSGDVFFATIDSGVARYGASGWARLDSEHTGLPSNEVHALVCDRHGTIWAGTAAGLAAFDGQRWRSYTTYNSRLPNNGIVALAVDRNNNVIIGMSEGGAAIFNENGISTGVGRPVLADADRAFCTAAPNPARNGVVFTVDVPHAGDVRLDLLALDGRQVATPHHGPLDAGRHDIRWDASALASGAYIVRVAVGATVGFTRLVVTH